MARLHQSIWWGWDAPSYLLGHLWGLVMPLGMGFPKAPPTMDPNLQGCCSRRWPGSWICWPLFGGQRFDGHFDGHCEEIIDGEWTLYPAFINWQRKCMNISLLNCSVEEAAQGGLSINRAKKSILYGLSKTQKPVRNLENNIHFEPRNGFLADSCHGRHKADPIKQTAKKIENTKSNMNPPGDGCFKHGTFSPGS